MSRCGGFSSQIRGLFTELVVTRHDKDALLALKGMAYEEIGVESVTVFGEVWGL